MRFSLTKKTVRCLSAAEGYLELNLPERALGELHRLDHPGPLEPYVNLLRGQALKRLERYTEAIDALSEAARTIPAPLNRQAWQDLGDCYRHEGLDDLANVVETFADDPWGGADRDLPEFLSDGEFSLCDEGEVFGSDFTESHEFEDRFVSDPTAGDDFEQYNFEGNWGEDSPTTPHERPQK